MENLFKGTHEIALPETGIENPEKEFNLPKRKRDYQINATKYLDETEFKQLMFNLDKHRRAQRVHRDVAALYAAIYTGARASEVLNLRREDLLSRYALSIRGLKGSRDREVPIPMRVYWTIHAYMISHNEPYIFPIGYRRLVQLWELWRPVKKSFHCLRHTFAIRLYKKTKDLRLVQVAMGHKNIQNTMVYADYVYQYSEMRKLMLGRRK